MLLMKIKKNDFLCSTNFKLPETKKKRNSISDCEFSKFTISVTADHRSCYLAMPLPTTRRVATNPSDLMTRNGCTKYATRTGAICTYEDRPITQRVCTWCVQVLRSPKEAFAAVMQSWRERCEKCLCLQGDYVEK